MVLEDSVDTKSWAVRVAEAPRGSAALGPLASASDTPEACTPFLR